MAQNFQIVVSLDDNYLNQFSTFLNNIKILSEQDNIERLNTDPISSFFTTTIELFVCFDGQKQGLDKISEYFSKEFPNFIFHFKHIPSECVRLYEFLKTYYPYSESRDTLQSCSVYYRMFLDEIWPNLEGWALNVDLDILFRRNIKDLFYDTIKLDGQKNEFALYACPYHRIECWDLRPQVLDTVYREWLTVEGRGLLQIFVDKWIDELIYIIQNHRPETDTAQFPSNFRTSAIHFNAGILMFNITKYRQDKLNKACRECIILQKQFKIFHHNDQGILNFVFFNRLGPLPASWNLCDFGCNLPRLYNPSPEQKSQYLGGRGIHFNGPHKPWDTLAKIPDYCKELWNKYKKNVSTDLLTNNSINDIVSETNKSEQCRSKQHIREWIEQIVSQKEKYKNTISLEYFSEK